MPGVSKVFFSIAALSSLRLFAFQSATITQFGDKATWENASTNVIPVSFAGLGGAGSVIDQSYPNGIQIGGVSFVANNGYLIMRTQSESSAIMYGPPDGDLGCPPPQAGGCGQPGAGIRVSLPPGITSVGLDVGSFWPPPLVAIRFSNGQVFNVPNAPLLQNFKYARLLRESADFEREAAIRGRLHSLGPHKAFAPDGDEQIHGELYRLREPERTLAALDDYEGEEYERAVVDVEGSPAWIYRLRA